MGADDHCVTDPEIVQGGEDRVDMRVGVVAARWSRRVAEPEQVNDDKSPVCRKLVVVPTPEPARTEQAMEAHTPVAVSTLEAVREVDRWARLYSQNVARGLELKV